MRARDRSGRDRVLIPRSRDVHVRASRFAYVLVTLLACVCGLAHADGHASASAAPPPSVAPDGVDVGGEIAKPTHLTLAALAAIPHVKLHASAHGVEGDWDGVPLIEILRAAGAPGGETLRGPALALYVRITAADGYRAVFALAELDPSTGDAQAILADRHDGKPLDANEGPLRVIVPHDKRPARWVRQVIAIELLRAPTR
jgi:DMSO/TMAO reductase YedYZ molybdopterin-dependent catalytic subunit